MKRNRRLQGRMVGEVLLLRLNVTLQSVKEFISLVPRRSLLPRCLTVESRIDRAENA